MALPKPRTPIAQLKSQLTFLLGLLAVMWLVEITDAYIARPLFGTTLDQYGLLPRQIIGLRGIVFSPFLHANFSHLLSNSLPFLILGGLVILHGVAEFIYTSLIVAVVGGLGTWLLGAPALHIGASGLIFGYMGYLLLKGYFERSLSSIALSVAVGGVYGGMLWGVLPNQPGVSWEGHLFGFIGGVLAARLLTRQQSNKTLAR
ncbi:rhomboid family intramembrane serine protease [Parachitinimonas caeni]|uniref:Rhomboid family intramembrane serine protease n=1 Tax=Parachitinimonas caeni TaxID=3031301 RepID=A0ABT7DWF2_9NEIS|nr:rhomboid family intramembrane serine protease [Parachitinimonas caeni]MDK2124397.1 rhomboid family intramembrane serine protease [Parachitinimonas caeni]